MVMAYIIYIRVLTISKVFEIENIWMQIGDELAGLHLQGRLFFKVMLLNSYRPSICCNTYNRYGATHPYV